MIAAALTGMSFSWPHWVLGFLNCVDPHVKLNKHPVLWKSSFILCISSLVELVQYSSMDPELVCFWLAVNSHFLSFSSLLALTLNPHSYSSMTSLMGTEQKSDFFLLKPEC